MDASTAANLLNELALLDTTMRAIKRHSNTVQYQHLYSRAMDCVRKLNPLVLHLQPKQRGGTIHRLMAEFVWHVECQRGVQENLKHYMSGRQRDLWRALVCRCMDQLEWHDSTVQSREAWYDRRKTLRSQLRRMEREPCTANHIVMWCLTA